MTDKSNADAAKRYGTMTGQGRIGAVRDTLDFYHRTSMELQLWADEWDDLDFSGLERGADGTFANGRSDT